MDYFWGVARWSLLVAATVMCAAVSGIGIVSF